MLSAKGGAEMPWQEQTVEEQRVEFVLAAQAGTIPFSELCRRTGISRKTGYKWCRRATDGGGLDLADHSRRPQTSPTQTPAAVEEQVLTLRSKHPTWGGRKIHDRLVQSGVAPVPAPSTITDILRRHGLLTIQADAPRRWKRFEHAAPNALWQLDFMGHRPLGDGQRVHPLPLLDDHSRFALRLVACPHERQPLVREHLTVAFTRYGLPLVILTDNGPPWGTSGAGGVTALAAWLLRLGVSLWHGRAYHPQTQGKVERLHGTIAADVFAHRPPPIDLVHCQAAFDAFRTTYNLERPHAALPDHRPPVSRYTPSPRPFPAALPPVCYGPDDAVRKVRGQGSISFQNRIQFVGRGLIGEPVAIRPTATDGVFAILYCHQQVSSIDLRDPDEV
jgi:transposase InsO family protein